MDIVNTVAKDDTRMLAKLRDLLESSLYRDEFIALPSSKRIPAAQLEPVSKICVGRERVEKTICGGIKNSVQRDTSATTSSAGESDDRDSSTSSRAISFKSWQSKLTVVGSKSSTTNNAATSVDTARYVAGSTSNFGGTTQKESEKWSKFLDRVDDKERQKGRDVKRERQRLAVKETEECFFSPNLTTKSLKIAASFECLRDRVPSILSARESYLHQQRAALIERETAECTFSPHRLSADCGDLYLSNPSCSFLPSADYRPYLEEKRRKEEVLRVELMGREADEFTFQPKTSAVQYLTASKERRLRANRVQHSLTSESASDQRMMTEHKKEYEHEDEDEEGVRPDSNVNANVISNSKAATEMELGIEIDSLGLDINAEYSKSKSSSSVGTEVISERERDVDEEVLSSPSRHKSKCSRSSDTSDEGEGYTVHEKEGGDDCSGGESSIDMDGEMAFRGGSVLDTTRSDIDQRTIRHTSSSSSAGSREVEDRGNEIATQVARIESVRARNAPMSTQIMSKLSDTGEPRGCSSGVKIILGSGVDGDEDVEMEDKEEEIDEERVHRHRHDRGCISNSAAHEGDQQHDREHGRGHDEEQVHVSLSRDSCSVACERLYRDGLMRVANRGKRNGNGGAPTSSSLSSSKIRQSASMKRNAMMLTQTCSFHASNQRSAMKESKMLRRQVHKQKQKKDSADVCEGEREGGSERIAGSRVGAAEQVDIDGDRDGDVDGVDPSDACVAVVDCNTMRRRGRGGEGEEEEEGERVAHMRLHQLWRDLMDC